MTNRLLLPAFIVTAAFAAGCTSSAARAADSTQLHADSMRVDSIARARQDSINRAQPGYVIDSLIPVAEEMRRFRKTIGGDSATRFVGGSPSREALVSRFMRSLAANDTADLRAMAVHAREFVDLYYPESPWAHPPYHQSPALAWSLIQNPGDAGFTKLLKRLGGKPIVYVDHKCDPKVAHDGKTTRYAGCIVRIVDAKGDTTTRLLFGSILERGGQFKFLSYSNRL